MGKPTIQVAAGTSAGRKVVLEMYILSCSWRKMARWISLVFFPLQENRPFFLMGM
jgi:hypothetical protein